MFAARSQRVFCKTWQRSGFWGLVILPPEVVPASARERPYLQAAVGLELAGRPQAAMQAYRNAVGRWPESLGAWMGLGNAAHASGDPAGAEIAFRQALRVDPEAGAAWNNLAQVLWERGSAEEAATAVRQAVALGGSLQPLFFETRRLIDGGRESSTPSTAPADTGYRSESR
jgi:tetratricopeptide (TPR) repeat protein